MLDNDRMQRTFIPGIDEAVHQTIMSCSVLLNLVNFVVSNLPLQSHLIVHWIGKDYKCFALSN